MSNFGGKNVQNLASAGASSQTPFEELTVLPLTPWLSWLHLRGYISKGKGREEEGRVNEGEKVGRKRSLPPPQSSPQIDATVYRPADRIKVLITNDSCSHALRNKSKSNE